MKNLRRLRKTLCLTQDAFAKSLDVSRTTVTMWETEHREPDYALLRKIAEKYEVSTDYLIGSGIFADWEQLMAHKAVIIETIEKAYPRFSRLQLAAQDERTLIRFLPALFAKIIVSDGEIFLFPLIPPESEANEPLSSELP